MIGTSWSFMVAFCSGIYAIHAAFAINASPELKENRVPNVMLLTIPIEHLLCFIYSCDFCVATCKALKLMHASALGTLVVS